MVLTRVIEVLSYVPEDEVQERKLFQVEVDLPFPPSTGLKLESDKHSINTQIESVEYNIDDAQYIAYSFREFKAHRQLRDYAKSLLSVGWVAAVI